MGRSAAWRDEAAAGLVLKHLPSLAPQGPVLVMQDPRDGAAEALEAGGTTVVRWHRRAAAGRAASPWPPAAPPEGGGGFPRGFGTVLLRLPRAKDELEMGVHAAASRLRPGGRLFVYGAKDEGAASAARRIEPLMGTTSTVATGGRCRLLKAVRPEAMEGLRGSLDAWRRREAPPHPELERGRRDAASFSWVSYPGVFAAGRLDAGTSLLLDHLRGDDVLPRQGPVLDFGCGDGVVAAVLRRRRPALDLTLLDVDAVALRAAVENVPGAPPVLGDGLAALDAGAEFDLIAANPPYHAGKAESLDVVERLISSAPDHLRPGGALVLVVQGRLPVEPLLHDAFGGAVSALTDGGAFRVWRGVRK